MSDKTVEISNSISNPDLPSDNNKLRNSIPSINVDRKEEKHEKGKMADNVGTGRHAQTNIIWYIVSATFVVFSCICSALVVMSIYGYEIKTVLDSIKDIWGVFTPILTLALGYLFGKQGLNNQEEKKY
ncbi:TPA: hypothetical protein ACIR59_004264 [Enterobacter hormaechei]